MIVVGKIKDLEFYIYIMEIKIGYKAEIEIDKIYLIFKDRIERTMDRLKRRRYRQ